MCRLLARLTLLLLPRRTPTTRFFVSCRGEGGRGARISRGGTLGAEVLAGTVAAVVGERPKSYLRNSIVMVDRRQQDQRVNHDRNLVIQLCPRRRRLVHHHLRSFLDRHLSRLGRGAAVSARQQGAPSTSTI